MRSTQLGISALALASAAFLTSCATPAGGPAETSWASLAADFDRATRRAAAAPTLRGDASDAALTALATELRAYLDINYAALGDGCFTDLTVNARGQQAAGVRIAKLCATGLAEKPVAALLAEGRAAPQALAQRIDASGITLTGAEGLLDALNDATTASVTSALGELEGSGALADVMNADYGGFSMAIADMSIEGFGVLPVPARQSGGDGEEAAALDLFATFASAWGRVQYDRWHIGKTTMAFDWVQGDLRTALALDLAFTSGAGARGAAYGAAISGPMSYVMRMSAADGKDSIPPFEMRVEHDGYVWSGVDLNAGIDAVLTRTMPALDKPNLFNLGRIYTLGERQFLNGNQFYAAGKGYYDISHFVGFLPTRIEARHEDVVLDLGGMFEFFRSLGTISGGDEAGFTAEQVQLMTTIGASLSSRGLSAKPTDIDFTYDWNAATGATSLRLATQTDDLAAYELVLNGALPSIKKLKAAQAQNGELDWAAFAGAFTAQSELADALLVVDDDGVLNSLFGFTSDLFGVRQFAENPQIAAMKNMSVDELRAASAAMLTMASIGVSAEVPSVGQWATEFGKFLQTGGTLTIRMQPKQALSANSISTLIVGDTPEQKLANFGISVTRTADDARN